MLLNDPVSENTHWESFLYLYRNDIAVGTIRIYYPIFSSAVVANIVGVYSILSVIGQGKPQSFATSVTPN